MSHDDAAQHADHDATGHGHEEAEPLGEVDVTAWTSALAGAGIGVVLILAMLAATQA